MIKKNSTIEEITTLIPKSIDYLMVKGIKCIKCGEPIWGTLEEAALNKGFGIDDIEQFVNDINELNNSTAVSDI